MTAPAPPDTPGLDPDPAVHLELVAVATATATGRVTYHPLGALDLTADADRPAALARALRELAAALLEGRRRP